MPLLRGPEIKYLDINHLKSHFNVTFVAENGRKVKVNNLQLAAFSETMLETLIDSDIEDTIIATNLDQDDLIMVANFITEGLLPLPCEELMTRMPDHVAKTFLSFGIVLKEVLSNDQEVTIKDEDLGDIVKLEKETFFNDSFDEDLPLIVSTAKKKRRRVRKEGPESKDSKSDDEDWTPKKPAIKKKKAEEEIIPEDQKPTQTRNERRIVQMCEKFLREFKDYAHLSIPDKSKPEFEALKSFVCDIDSYRSKPKRKENNNLVRDINRTLPCSLCPAWLSTPNDVKRHKLLFHQEHFQCNLCVHADPLDQPENFKLHMFRHANRKHECIHCGFASIYLSNLETHFKKEGPFHNNKCVKCPATFPSHVEYQSHVETSHGGSWTYICGICNEPFDSMSKRKEHRKNVHKVGIKVVKTTIQSMVCDLCGKELKNAWKLKEHYRHYHVEDSQKCPQCPKICKTKKHLENHIASVHMKLPCEHCGIMIPVKRKKQHMQAAHVNPEDRECKCETCGKGFAYRHLLKDHINIHTGERPYVCKYCGQGFANQANNRAHIRQAHLGQKRSYPKK